MKLTSIKSKIVALVVGVGVILGAFQAFYSPYQAESLGTNILKNDTGFIAMLLSENLSLGMQTVFLDDGAALDQTLSLLKRDKSSGESIVSDVWVYDKEYKFVASLNGQWGHQIRSDAGAKFLLTDEEDQISVWSPLYDSDRLIIGYVDMEFSKAYLQEQV